jgi:hypothetical protein
MAIDRARLDLVRNEICEVTDLAPYQAVNGLWIGLVKLANLLPTVGEEHEQVASLLRRLSRPEAASVVADAGVDQLLDLDPPLETFLADDRERLYPLPAAKEIARIREQRLRDPKAALASLFEIVQRVRDKREHGFKSTSGDRDGEILCATRSILKRMCEAVFENLAASDSALGDRPAQFGS